MIENTTNGHCKGALPDDTTTSPVDSRDDYRRLYLEPYVGEAVTVEAVLAKVTKAPGVTRTYLNGLFKYCEITLPDRARHHTDHLMVSNVEGIKHLGIGTRVLCSCTVHRYFDRAQPTVTRYGVGYPSLIEVVAPPHDPMTDPMTEALPQTPPHTTGAASVTTDLVAVFLEVNDLVQKAGGAKVINDLLAAVGLAGGWEAVNRVNLLIEQLGGVEKLEQVLGVLKGV
jgi:hypothetical protein